jgi:hypothetical protein
MGGGVVGPFWAQSGHQNRLGLLGPQAGPLLILTLILVRRPGYLVGAMLEKKTVSLLELNASKGRWLSFSHSSRTR